MRDNNYIDIKQQYYTRERSYNRWNLFTIFVLYLHHINKYLLIPCSMRNLTNV